MHLRKYTSDQLKDAVRQHTSLRAVLVALGVRPAGGNYLVLRKAIVHYRLDTTHFTGRAWRRGRTGHPRWPLSDYLSNRQPIQSYKLKQRLVREGVVAAQCAMCHRTRWLNHPIPLELDHINGQPQDNRLHNLRLLCPNCHALTPTYRGKNIAPSST